MGKVDMNHDPKFLQERLPFLQALIDGKIVERKSGTQWKPILFSETVLCKEAELRIKPEPLTFVAALLPGSKLFGISIEGILFNNLAEFETFKDRNHFLSSAKDLEPITLTEPCKSS